MEDKIREFNSIVYQMGPNHHYVIYDPYGGDDFKSDLIKDGKAVLNKWYDSARRCEDFESVWGFQRILDLMENIDSAFDEHKKPLLDVANAYALNYLFNSNSKLENSTDDYAKYQIEGNYLKIDTFLRDEKDLTGFLKKQAKKSKDVVKEVTQRNIEERANKIIAYEYGPFGAFPIRSSY